MSRMRTEITGESSLVGTNVPIGSGVEVLTEAEFDVMDDLIFGPVPGAGSSARQGSAVDVEEARGGRDDEWADFEALDDAMFGLVDTSAPRGSVGYFRG